MPTSDQSDIGQPKRDYPRPSEQPSNGMPNAPKYTPCKADSGNWPSSVRGGRKD